VFVFECDSDAALHRRNTRFFFPVGQGSFFPTLLDCELSCTGEMELSGRFVGRGRQRFPRLEERGGGGGGGRGVRRAGAATTGDDGGQCGGGGGGVRAVAGVVAVAP